MRSKLLQIFCTLILMTSLSVAQDLFVRSGVINLEAEQVGGVGNVLSGLDLDGDGKLEIYAVNDNWGDGPPEELIPKIYKFENDGGTWTEVWSTVLAIPLQNTWPALTTGDLDADGKGEVIWGPVNNTGGGNDNPARIVIFEVVGDGSDNLGIDNGDGTFSPNAVNQLTTTDGANIRPFRAFIEDIDSDGTDEIIFSDRRIDGSEDYHLGVISVSDVPDAGDGSETWTIEFSGVTPNPQFVRSAVIDFPAEEVGGVGNIVSGVDIDGDGFPEIYAVNDNWADTDYEVIPRIYKYEWNGMYWEQVWMTVLTSVPKQNTWPPLEYNDWDGDGKGEIIWGPINNFDTDPNPARIVVFETPGDGSDVMGIDNGDGTYSPNASWSVLPPGSDQVNMRPFRTSFSDIDNDGTVEMIFSDRASHMFFGVISVDNIPDNGDGSETWTLELSGLSELTIKGTGNTGTLPGTGSNWLDLAVIDNTIYLFTTNGDVLGVQHNGTTWEYLPEQVGVTQWLWKTVQVVDIDKDGTKEIIGGTFLGGSGAKVFLFQQNGDLLTSTEIAEFTGLGADRLVGSGVGDFDGDGNVDFVFGTRSDPVPNGLIIRLEYQGGDITDPNSYTQEAIDQGLLDSGGQYELFSVADHDADGMDEIVYSGIPRGSAAVPIAIVEYQDGTIAGGNKWDIAVVDNYAYLFDGGGNVFPVKYENAKWQIMPQLTGVVSDAGSFKGSTVADIDGDGSKEIVVAEWISGSNNKIRLLQQMNGGLKSTVIADALDDTNIRLNGAASGDIDQDGFMDFVFGSRNNNGSIYRLEHRGGAIDDPANYVMEKIDEGIVAGANQLDIVTLGNVDDDDDLEVIYSGIPRDIYGTTIIPIVVLDLQKVQTTPIADVRVDADGNFIPDNDGLEFTIVAVVTSVNLQANSGDLGIYVQDETAGIFVFSNDNTNNYDIGKLLQITGSVTQFNGLTEIVAEPAGIVDLGTGTVPAAKVLRVDRWLNNAEMYEGQLIKIAAAAPLAGETWPSGSSGNYDMWDGFNEFTVRIDSDTDLDDNVEPTAPMSLVGVAGQFDSSDPYDEGYQLLPQMYTDIAQGLQVPPHPFMELTSPADGAEVTITSPDMDITISWAPTLDLNGDNVLYQFVILPNLADFISNNGGADPSITLKGSDVLALMGGATSVTVDWTVRTTDLNNDPVPSVDTSSVTFIDNTTGVEDEITIPTEYFVDQNYPNPFNPTTTIQFGLPEAAEVDLRVYDILGREVATLIGNRSMNAGYHAVVFNANKLASGQYIYRLTAGKKTEVRKMLLLK